MIIDFQTKMTEGKANAKRRLDKFGSSSVRVFTTADLYRGQSEQDWIAPVVTQPTIDRAAIMRRAHQIAKLCRSRFSTYRAALSYGLKASWEESRGLLDFAA
jgi:hypothetical protein